ncbi:MAG: hypothetical protein ACR2LL_01830 [Nitrosopumilus sp.]|uniref:hypothetical protein n=1 Tax=Nitrosopumilus sp. TaxID=2024843 RepID=UPI00292E5798|nr:hypothetical protein [Nitrosopumilus sp.]
MTSHKERQEVKPEFYSWLNNWTDKEKTTERLKLIFGMATEIAAFKLGLIVLYLISLKK